MMKMSVLFLLLSSLATPQTYANAGTSHSLTDTGSEEKEPQIPYEEYYKAVMEEMEDYEPKEWLYNKYRDLNCADRPYQFDYLAFLVSARRRNIKTIDDATYYATLLRDISRKAEECGQLD